MIIMLYYWQIARPFYVPSLILRLYAPVEVPLICLCQAWVKAGSKVNTPLHQQPIPTQKNRSFFGVDPWLDNGKAVFPTAVACGARCCCSNHIKNDSQWQSSQLEPFFRPWMNKWNWLHFGWPVCSTTDWTVNFGLNATSSMLYYHTVKNSTKTNIKLYIGS